MNERYVCPSTAVHAQLTRLVYCFLHGFRSLSFLVKLEQLDLGSNELEVLVMLALSMIL